MEQNGASEQLVKRCRSDIAGYIVLVAVCLVVIALAVFICLPSAPEIIVPPGGSEPPPVGTPAFMQMASAMTGSPAMTGGAVEPIDRGAAFFPELFRDIDQATSSIVITDFPWNNGSTSERLLVRLTAAARRGVAVRVLLDGYGGRTVPRQWIADLESAGGEVRAYNPFDIFHPLDYNVRDHERAFVIDGTTAWTGGMGIVDYWDGTAQGFSEWQDLMFEVHGNMAASIFDNFSSLWKASGGSDLPGSALGSATDPDLGQQGQNIPYISVAGVPAAESEPVRDLLLLTAMAARKRLYIESAYIIPDRQLLDILEAKARTGVDVRVISPGPITAAPILRSAWHADYAELLSAGVRLYEYQPTMIHSKIMVADDVWSVVGSANIDDRSQTINAEDVLGVSNPILAGKLEAIFNGDMASSTEITMSAWLAEYGFFDHVASEFWLIFRSEM